MTTATRSVRSRSALIFLGIASAALVGCSTPSTVSSDSLASPAAPSPAITEAPAPTQGDGPPASPTPTEPPAPTLGAGLPPAGGPTCTIVPLNDALALLGVAELQQLPDDSQPGVIDGCGYTDAAHMHNIYYTVQVGDDAQSPLDFIQFRKDYTLSGLTQYDPGLGDASVAADDSPGAGALRTRIYFARGNFGAYVVVTTPDGGKTAATDIATRILTGIG